MKVILDLNPDEALALIQVLEKDILFRDLTDRVIDDIERYRHEWANEVRNLGYLRAGDTPPQGVSAWQEFMQDMAKKPELREAIANYMYSEGCSCCRDDEAHELAASKLAALLDVPQYEDGSGYDFYQFRSEKKKVTHKESNDES